MKLSQISGVIFTLVLLTLVPLNGFPHPGRTDANGCHTCRTNCTERWGIPYGFYHRHHPVRPCFELPTPVPTQTPENAAFIEPSLCAVTRVMDGDTLECSSSVGKTEIIRLIGVDTPETKHPNKPVEHFGKEATAFTKKMVGGETIRLEYDWQTKDKYGRTLAYVYLLDGTFLNAEIIKQGYGFAYTEYPFKYKEQFREYERDARLSEKGLWNEQILQ